MKNKDSKRHEATLKIEDVDGFLKEFLVDNNRAMVILGVARLDAQIEKLLRKLLIDDEKEVSQLMGPDRPLSSFGSRIQALYCLGIFNKEELGELRAFKNIRNKFAHELHGLSFESPEIKKYCSQLRVFAEPLMDKAWQSFDRKFLTAILLWLEKLEQRFNEIEKIIPRKEIDREYEIDAFDEVSG